MKASSTFIFGAMLLASAAQAQDRPAQGARPAGQRTPLPSATPAPAAPAAAPAPTATPAAATAVTDAEVSQFATAALAIEKIRKDTTVPEADKKARFVAEIQATGLDPARFNAIGQAMPADPALNARIQAAAAAQQPAQPAPQAQ